MNNLISELILYSGIKNDKAVNSLCKVYETVNSVPESELLNKRPALLETINSAVKEIAQAAQQYGLRGNVWQQYVILLFLDDENPFTLQAERRTVKRSGTTAEFALHDFRICKSLCAFDFKKLEKLVGIKHFSKLSAFKETVSDKGNAFAVNSELIKDAALKLMNCGNDRGLFDVFADFYKQKGAGIFAFDTAFRVAENAGGAGLLEIEPVVTDRNIYLDALVGLELQKKQLRDNTKAFCSGKRSNDVLLYGDNGTGKSTSIKAILNEFSPNGLRLIEVNKYQFRLLPELMTRIAGRNYRFIIFIDDLSFEEDEIEYKFLKSVIEGGIENRPDNILIYATSNRRHLIKEMWDDRKDMEYNGEIHHSDTIEEKISLSSRFGVTINFSKPGKKEYEDIVLELARRQGLKVDEKTLLAEADRWELRHGGFTGRVATQFINHMTGLES